MYKPVRTTIAMHPDFGASENVHLYRGNQNRAFVGGYWRHPMIGGTIYANVPADEVTVCVAAPLPGRP